MDILYASSEGRPLWPESVAGSAEVECVVDVPSLEERLESGRVDCLVVDATFTDEPPATLLRRVREGRSDVPFVLYGADIDDAVVESLYESPLTDYVTRGGNSDPLVLARRVDALVAARERDAFGGPSPDGAPTTTLTLDAEGEIRFASGDVTALFGTAAADLTGRGAEALFSPDLLEAVFEGGAPSGSTISTRLRRDDGSDLAVEASVRRSPTGGKTTVLLRGVDEATGPAVPSQGVEEVMNRVSDAFFGLDSAWRFTYLNDRAEELLGRPKESLVGRELWAEFAPARESTFESEYRRAMTEQTDVSFTEYYPPLETWFEVHAYPSETGLSVYFRDGTEQKQTADEGRASQSLTRSLSEATSLDAGLEAAVDAVVSETDWAYGEGWCAEAGELVPTEHWRHAPVGPVAHAASLSAIREGLADLSTDDAFVARTLDDGELVRHDVPDAGLETAVTAPVVVDGEVAAVLVFGLHAAREDVDRLVGTVETAATRLASFADRLESRADHRRRTRQFEAAFEDPTAGMLLLDGEGYVERANDVSRGYLPDDVLDGRPAYWEHPWWEGADTDAEEAREYVDRVLAGEYVRFETVNDRVADEPVALDVSLRPVADEAGDVVGAVAESRDVSDRYRLEADLREERDLTHLILETSPVGIAIVTATDGVEFVNGRGEEILAQFPDSVLDQPTFLGSDGRALSPAERPHRRVLDGGESLAGVDLGIDLGERVRWFSVGGAPLGDGDRAVMTFVEVTDRRERTEALAARTAELERLDRINRTIRELTGGLLDADSRAAVERTTADCVADADRYPLAWVGTVEGGSLRVTARAGDRGSAVEGFAEAAGPESPPLRAVDTGEVQVETDLTSEAAYGPWRELAREHEVDACAAVPLSHYDTRYGTLVIAASDPDGFGALEREVLGELGEMVGYAIASLERRMALASDRSTELEFSFPVSDLRLFPFLREERISIVIREVVPRGDGRAHFFFETVGVTPETVLDEMTDAPAVERVSRVDDGEAERPRFEAVLPAETSTARLLERGFVVHDSEVVGDRLHLTIRASMAADPREVLEVFEREYDDVRLVSKREVPAPVRSAQPFEASYLDSLTRRQEEVLRTAHAVGFFEWPRLNSGQDVAAMLGVAQPTVNRHLREAERKLFDALFGAPAPEG